VLLLLFLLIIYVRPQDMLSEMLNARIVFAVVSLTVVVYALKEVKRRTTRILYLTSDYWLIVLAVIAVVSTFQANYVPYTVSTIIAFLKFATFYFLVSFILDDEMKIGIFIHTFVFATTFVCAVAILQRFGIDLFKVGMTVDGRIQGVGIFNNPNYLAYSTTFAIPFAFGLVFRRRELLSRALGSVALGIFLWAIILTKSRGGLLCLLLTLFFIFTQTKGKTLRLLSYVCAGVIIMAAIQFGFGRMGSLMNMQTDKAIMDRVDAWYVAIQMFKQNPFFGVGYDLFMNFFFKATHSSFVQVGAELGFIGLFCWLGLIIFFFKRTRWLIANSSLSPAYTLGMEGTLMAYIITSFFATMGYHIIFFVLGGLVAGAQRIELARGVSSEHDRMILTDSGFRLKELATIFIATVGVVFLWHILIGLVQ